MLIFRLGFPPELKKLPQEQASFDSCLWYQINDDDSTLTANKKNRITLSSYVVKNKSSKMKVCVVLATHRVIKGVTKDDGKRKPALNKFYDFTKGGTDIFDQRMDKFSCKAKCQKWPHVTFYYLLDCTRVNAQTIWSLNNQKNPRKQNSFEWGMSLGMELIKIAAAARSVRGLSSFVKTTLNDITDREPEDTAEDIELDDLLPAKSEDSQLCRECLANIHGAEYRQKRKKLGKIKTQCQNKKCGLRLCQQHLVALCKDCLKK